MTIPFAHTSLPNPLNLYPLTLNSSPSLRLLFPSPCRSALTSKSLLFPFSRFPFNKVHTLTKASSSTVSEINDFSDILDDLGRDGEADDDLAGSPWEGAVVYRRDASVSHVEYCTTLERLGLGKLSSEVSQSRAAAMGIRLPTRRPKNSTFGDEGTPVLVSLDITKMKRRLRLDGIVRTVITLGCNRCAEPAAECVFSNLNLLLTEDPLEEPDVIDMGTTFREDRHKGSFERGKEDNDEEIDLDDQLYFPAQEKEIDISKHIRDIIHIEISLNGLCDTNCKGVCLRCGTNLNRSCCNCTKDTVKGVPKEYGPLKNLRKQMQKT
ncbi:large ribosomal RNA subunit accumulation protein YCED homolog 1, chloroplastic-like [Zingiber officinale]|uniref:Large ribosomal RNA subunit accumulation protein YCED homolog 1, chloroplastic n=1 Tax=Zingiber officinale TaxID=94328 RepID=A0A8J5CGL0_ZINOF|nr:large ribosomal RNA subunit accumulation protein YCED homolog 1, chloroplastic-like [Zingiber officinale]KAG6474171.1 hypothetical protein ZIOFF_068095 [Zingiber officinale]